ncbi:ADP-ribosylglycohydrolase [Actinacidiphila yanglinensis]|uniref:ADP-ribosylglycohydrolase n=1 Tax=Actinacidiphila yanglinensis TaxID=310779 RepID=A0A1H6D6Z6_9ACTN|nr:ADP-ribosylglycohydrolase family protein [Actinacidiphila yanglinensis]SEG80326.1 ADP-ribosylglycohydrolase [Actinacidiphila yanglinensis]
MTGSEGDEARPGSARTAANGNERPTAARSTPGNPKSGTGREDGGAAASPQNRFGEELRLTWVQPEDLVGHELRQAGEDGRDASAVQARWLAAGGHLAPERAGASPGPGDSRLRALADTLLDELAAQDSPLAEQEPTGLAGVHAAAGPPATVRPVDRPRELAERLEAGWLGRAVGCVLGKPVEKLPLEGIRAIAASTGNWPVHGYFTEIGLDPEIAARYPWNRRSRPTSLAENIDGMPEDDDLNYPLLGLMLLEAHGHGFTTRDVAALWLDELPAGRTFTAERIAYRNLLAGLEPPRTATWRNPFREWIGALIRADVFGWTRPADPAAAADEAWRDAVLSHTANGVYGAMFAAAAVARAAGGGADVHACLAAGLQVVPRRSRLSAAVRSGIELARAEPTGTPEGFASVVDELHRRYRDHHWVHVLPNAALLAAALTHAEGDFAGSICRVVSGGWDTDSNGATAGSLTGLLAGSPAALPGEWTGPLKNRLASTVGGFDGIGFDALARRTAALAVLPPGQDRPTQDPHRQDRPGHDTPTGRTSPLGTPEEGIR